jgi:glycosyltransferase involved in cell wall biosynthesis
VILEALASARPAIVVAHGGPAEIVDDEIGRALPAEGAAAVVDGLAEALVDVRRDPERWQRRGEAGRRRAIERYSWDAKVAEVLDLYRRLQPGGERRRAARPRPAPPSPRPVGSRA